MRRSALTPGITYDEASGRYRGTGGRYLSGAQVREALDAALDRAERAVVTNSEALRAGRINLAAWQSALATEIKNTHLAAGALARGGWAQMSPAANGAVGAAVKREYAYLRDFAAEIASGEQRLDGTLARRAGMYVQAGRNTYHDFLERDAKVRGATEERSLRSPGDSCEGCISAEAAGWAPIGTLPKIGRRECLVRCRCRMEHR